MRITRHAGRSAVREPVHEVHAGERVDGYRVGDLLYEGGMARLYRVTHPRHRGSLIMKVPKLGPDSPLSAYSAHENERHILVRLHGPHVPRLVAAGDPSRRPYLVMEYLEGDTLARAAARAPVALDALRDLGARLCRAVYELHRQNVIHLDLNPRNVRDRPDGTLVLVDFGMAHHAQLPDLIDRAFGEEEGTTPFIAPEQVRHVRTDSRSDIYAIGAILYLLATGVYPFGRPNLLSLNKRLFQPPRPPRCHVPTLPAWLQEVILRCLEIRPEARYASPVQVAHLLAHPGAVHVTSRGARTRPPGRLTRARLWLRSLSQVFDEGEPAKPYERIAGAPHVLVALDLAHTSRPQQESMRAAVRRVTRSEPGSYVTCLAVRSRVGSDETGPGAGAAGQLVAMRHWAQPLQLPPDRVFFQVTEGNPGNAILDYARTHAVDYIVVGARGSSAMRRFLGSVSTRVVASAACTVIVARSRREHKTSAKRV
jgi:serine/threonine protein kinase